jgi:ABC-type amino acid transport substrate-binding protein
MSALLNILLFIQAMAAPAKPIELEIALSDVGPFSYMENGTLHGINYEIFTQLAEKTGFKFNYKLYPHLRLINSLKNIDPDMAIFFSVSCDQYPLYYERKELVYTMKPTLFLKDSVKFNKETLRVGLLRGSCVDLSTKYLKQELVTEVSDIAQAIEMLHAGRLDGVCGLPALVNFAVKQKKYPEKLVTYKTDSQVLEGVICRKKSLSPEIKKKLDEAFKTVKIPHID